MNVTTAAPYDTVADVYDLVSASYQHDRWINALLERCSAHGLRPNSVLDVGCGSGHSFLPMLDRGLTVTACDISAGMVDVARRRTAGRCDVHVADMRRLPQLGWFDLVTCLDDAINHLDSPSDVADALFGMRANLAPGGVVVFDALLLGAYAASHDHVFERDDSFVVWRKRESEVLVSGGATQIVVDIFRRDGESWSRDRFVQPHRHYPVEELVALAGEAGLRLVHVYGQRPGGLLEDRVDESRDHKAVLILAAK